MGCWPSGINEVRGQHDCCYCCFCQWESYESYLIVCRGLPSKHPIYTLTCPLPRPTDPHMNFFSLHWKFENTFSTELKWMTCCHVRLCSAVLNYPHITPRHTTFISDCGKRQCDFSYLSTSGTSLLFLINLQSDLWCEHLDIFHTCGNFPPADIKTSAVESHRRSVFQHSTSLRWFQWRTTKVHVDPSKDLSSRKAPAPRSEVHTGVPFHLTKPRWSRKDMVWF